MEPRCNMLQGLNTLRVFDILPAAAAHPQTLNVPVNIQQVRCCRLCVLTHTMLIIRSNVKLPCVLFSCK